MRSGKTRPEQKDLAFMACPVLSLKMKRNCRVPKPRAALLKALQDSRERALADTVGGATS